MKITFVSQYFHPDPFSNTAIVRELVARGHEVRVVTGVPSYATGTFQKGYSNRERRRENWEGAEVERVYTIARGRSNVRLIVNYLGYALFAALRLWRRPNARPDVILVSQLSPVLMIWPAIVHRRRTGAPVICWVQDIWPESATFTLGLTNPLLVRPLRWLSGWLYRRPDLVLVQSAAFPEMIERFGVPSDRIRLFPNTAPDDHVPRTPGEAPDEAALVPQQGFRLMFAGNIGESQDFDTLIAAADLLRDRPELSWVIVGSGRDLARVQRAVGERGLAERFVFAGRHPAERMPYFFAHADAMLVSLKDTPVFGLTVPYKVQGYMACAKPIIGSLNGEGARIIEEAGAGIVVPASAPQELAATIRTMLDMDPEDRRLMGRNARAYFDANFAAAKVYGDLETWLREQAARHPPRRRA